MKRFLAFFHKDALPTYGTFSLIIGVVNVVIGSAWFILNKLNYNIPQTNLSNDYSYLFMIVGGLALVLLSTTSAYMRQKAEEAKSNYPPPPI